MLSEGTIVSGFVSKIINDITDISITKAKEAVKNKNNRHQNIESQIYNITINVLKKMTIPKFDNESGKIYDAAEKILIDIKRNNNTIEKTIEENLNALLVPADNEKCEEFIRLLCHEIISEDYNELYKEILLLHDRKESQKTFRIEQKVNNILQHVSDIKSKNESIPIIPSKKFQNNKKEKYIQIWNDKLFLHRNNMERPILLKDVFIIPKCFSDSDMQINLDTIQSGNRVLDLNTIEKILNKMASSSEDYESKNCYSNNTFMDENVEYSNNYTIDKIIQNFIEHKGTSSMLIIGVPGIGKTSIVSWIANEFRDNNNVIILRFRDWEIEELNIRLLRAIYNTLQCFRNDLEDKILILDGFDEIKSIHSCEVLLNDFFNDILDFENLKIIITSRPNYINRYNFTYTYELLPFDIFQIQKFYQLITSSKLDSNKITYKNLDILGIPVILYMAIMSNIDFTQDATKPELFNRIFKEKGGIFDKFSYIGNGYDNGVHLLRDKNNIKIFFKFLQEVSFIMFEKDSLVLYKEDYQTPELWFYDNNVSILDFPIKYLFENIGNGIEFIHKSLYEYFLSEHIFTLMNEAINTNQKNMLSGVLGKLFKKRTLSVEVLDFLKFKISNSNLSQKVDIVNQAFQEMLEHGMTYYTGECFENVIECEMNVFANMLELLHLWDENILYIDDLICHYLKYNTKKGLNLKNVYIEHGDLTGVNLVNANLSGANLSYCILKNANLDEINIDKAILTNVDLRDTSLSKVNFKTATLENVMLENAKIYETVFSEKQIAYLEQYYNLEWDTITTTDLSRILHSIRIKSNIFDLDGSSKKVLCQTSIDMLIIALNRRKKDI